MCAVSFHGSAFLINFEIPKASATRTLISLVRVVCLALIEIATNIYLKSDHKDSLSLAQEPWQHTNRLIFCEARQRQVDFDVGFEEPV